MASEARPEEPRPSHLPLRCCLEVLRTKEIPVKNFLCLIQNTKSTLLATANSLPCDVLQPANRRYVLIVGRNRTQPVGRNRTQHASVFSGEETGPGISPHAKTAVAATWVVPARATSRLLPGAYGWIGRSDGGSSRAGTTHGAGSGGLQDGKGTTRTWRERGSSPPAARRGRPATRAAGRRRRGGPCGRS